MSDASAAHENHGITDPILLEALLTCQAESHEAPKPGRTSRYRGVARQKDAGSACWSAFIGTGGKKFALGKYHTEVEAALARNYAVDLLRPLKRVENVIPPEVMPNEATQKRVARRVVSCLRARGVTLPAPAT